MDYLLGQLIGQINSTYAKSTTVSAEIGLTADGSGYEITLPWFKIENGLIADCGTNKFTVPQLFKKFDDGSVIIEWEE